MKKKLLSVLLSTAMVASLFVGCGSSAATDDSAAADDSAATDAATTATADDSAATDDSASAGEGGFVGVAMPPKALQRWRQDGSNMQAELEAAGY